MRFLADHDVYAATTRFVAALGHDVATAFQLGLAQRPDSDLLQAARDAQRILLTRDRDFGNIVFVQNDKTGIIYLRMLPSMQNAVYQELQRLLNIYPEQELLNSFVVVEPGQHRIRRFTS
jgi:predicted nuclease of predicted toxin-antitoxin system